MSRIFERVQQCVCDELGFSEDDVGMDTSFVNDLGADSLDIVQLVMEFEEKFNITIPDEEAEKMQTVRNVVDYIENPVQAH